MDPDTHTHTELHMKTQMEDACEDRAENGVTWPQARSRREPLKGALPRQHLESRLLASRTVRRSVPAVSSLPIAALFTEALED